MSNPYAAFCEDFYVNMRLGSQLALPHNRETVLHFFERLQKAYPAMTKFRRNDNNEFNLEEDRGSHAYRWASLENKRVSSGHVNPTDVADAMRMHELVLDMSPSFAMIPAAFHNDINIAKVTGAMHTAFAKCK